MFPACGDVDPKDNATVAFLGRGYFCLREVVGMGLLSFPT